ncbi:MAG: transcriptional repressor NrdR [Acidimicrobiia bacterium]|nr:transcriptional repressor NrdR [Acidimicrobiia bacterium]
MRCPFCPAPDTRVVDSRSADGGASVRRRRACVECERRFTTYERAEVVPVVRKRDGRLERFDSAKLRRGMVRAMADRPIPAESVDRLVEEIEQAVGRRDVVTADEIGHAVLAGLRQLDEVAYLRYASVYKEFTGAEDFEREMAELEGKG